MSKPRMATLEVSTAVKTRCCPVLETMTKFTEIAFRAVSLRLESLWGFRNGRVM